MFNYEYNEGYFEALKSLHYTNFMNNVTLYNKQIKQSNLNFNESNYF
jgi:hypothetical protein